MNRSKLKALLLGATAALVIADGVLVALVAKDAAFSIAWGRIVGAIALQVVVLAILAAWLVLRPAVPSLHDESPASYRRQIPVTLIGVVLVATALSLDLLYTGIVCPQSGIPVFRGQPMCPANSK